jgi:hypothetical protein
VVAFSARRKKKERLVKKKWTPEKHAIGSYIS